MFRVLVALLLFAMVLPHARTPLCRAAAHHDAGERSSTHRQPKGYHVDDHQHEGHLANAGSGTGVVGSPEGRDCHAQMGCDRVIDGWRNLSQNETVTEPTRPRDGARLPSRPSDILRTPIAPPPKTA